MKTRCNSFSLTITPKVNDNINAYQPVKEFHCLAQDIQGLYCNLLSCEALYFRPSASHVSSFAKWRVLLLFGHCSACSGTLTYATFCKLVTISLNYHLRRCMYLNFEIWNLECIRVGTHCILIDMWHLNVLFLFLNFKFLKF